MIYFDNAATTLQKPPQVAQAVYEAISTMGNASRGVNEAALTTMRTVYETRKLVAELFHFENPERVAFTMNATESLNMAIRGTLKKGDHVITSVLEHNSVLRPLYLMEKEGVELSILEADETGCVDSRRFADAIRPNTKAIITTHASNLTGNAVDIKALGELCRQEKLLFVVDASQTAGILPIDMEDMHISVLCFTGHKSLFGPQGTGGICVAEGVEISPFKVGGSGTHSYLKGQPDAMPTKLEAGTLNGHGIAGLNAALKFRKAVGSETIRKKETALMRQFYNGVKEIPGVKIYGNFQREERAPIVSLNIGDYESGMVSDELMMRFEIATRSGAHCAPLMHEALGTKEQGAVRFSFSWFNTEEEISRGIEAVARLATED